MNEHTTGDYAETLKEVRDYADKLNARLPKCVQATAFTGKSKLPFKAAAIRELLLHRTAALASSTVDLYEQNRVIPAMILTRSIVETVALLFNFHERLESFLSEDGKDRSKLDDFLMCCLMGSRNTPEMPKAVNVLNLIDKIEKTFPDFRFAYDALSEYAHPNWAGTFGAFGRGHGGNSPETTKLELGLTECVPPYSTGGLLVLSGSLIAFEYLYDHSGEVVAQLNEYFDKNIAQ